MYVYWRHLANTIERSVLGGDAALCQITLTIRHSLPAGSMRSLKLLFILRVAFPPDVPPREKVNRYLMDA